jgi:hypothetical protein
MGSEGFRELLGPESPGLETNPEIDQKSESTSSTIGQVGKQLVESARQPLLFRFVSVRSNQQGLCDIGLEPSTGNKLDSSGI